LGAYIGLHALLVAVKAELPRSVTKERAAVVLLRVLAYPHKNFAYSRWPAWQSCIPVGWLTQRHSACIKLRVLFRAQQNCQQHNMLASQSWDLADTSADSMDEHGERNRLGAITGLRCVLHWPMSYIGQMHGSIMSNG
jgi:hypothetical protein